MNATSQPTAAAETFALITWSADGVPTTKRFTRVGGLVEVQTVPGMLFGPSTATLSLSAARRLWSMLLADGWQRVA